MSLKVLHVVVVLAFEPVLGHNVAVINTKSPDNSANIKNMQLTIRVAMH